MVETDHPVGGHKGKSHQGIVEECEPEKYHRNQAISRMSGQLLFAFLQPSASLKASLVFASFIRTEKKIPFDIVDAYNSCYVRGGIKKLFFYFWSKGSRPIQQNSYQKILRFFYHF